jgi:hypothetical protein
VPLIEGRRPNLHGLGLERLGIDGDSGLTPDAYGRIGVGLTPRHESSHETGHSVDRCDTLPS